MLRADVLKRFARDDERVVRGVLADLVDSRLAFRSGRGDATVYRAPAEGDILSAEDDSERSLTNLVWTAVHRFGPLSLSDLSERVPADHRALEAALSRLLAEGCVADVGAAGRRDGKKPESSECVLYQSENCVLPVGDPAGWEASVFDHYQSVVTALCTKLRLNKRLAERSDLVGGSTYHFDVWPGHPHYEEVAGSLAVSRARFSALRKKVELYNADHASPEDETRRFTTYVGQTVVDAESEGEES